jgi:CubicO group peptidase (beta-lactamase class C family)
MGYFTAGVVVLGDIIHKSVPNGLEKYANTNVFQPLGITKYKWQFTPQKVANTAGSLQLRSLDYAKFGQLYKTKVLGMGNKFYQRMDRQVYHTK